jgi:flagellar motor switch protein FliN/FliY
VNETVSVPYSWLKTIDPELLKSDSVPLLGNPPNFPWSIFQQEVANFFQVKELELHPGEIRWRSPQELFEGFASDRQSLNIAFSSLDGHVTWILNSRDVAFLMSSIIQQKAASSDELDIDKEFLEGFYNFAALEVLNIIAHTDFDKTLTPQLLDDHTEPNTNCLSLDVDVKLYGKAINGRLLIPPPFHSSWKENYSQRKLKTPLSKALSDNIDLTIHLEAGRSALAMQEFKDLHTGDFIVLDTYSIDPESHQGKVTLTLDGKALYLAQLQDGNLKILESPPIQEVITNMDKHYPSDDEDDEDELEHDMELDELEEQNDDHHIEEEEEEFSEERRKKTEAPKAPAKPTSQAAAAPTTVKAKTVTEEHKPFSPDDIPVNLIIEAGRLQISIKKLLDLQPGNILELDIKPENGVSLVVNSRVIGKGELLKVGDTLGVRILDLG